MRRILLLLGAAVLTSGCRTQPSNAPAPTPDHSGMDMDEHATPGGDAAEDHRHLSLHGGQVGMSREPNLHLEAVRTADEVRVYVYDAAMTPVPLAEVSGRVKVGDRSLALEPRTADGSLFAKVEKAGPLTAAFELTVRGARVQMEFDLAQGAAANGAASFDIGGHLAQVDISGDMLDVRITEKDGQPPHGAKNAKVVLQIGTDKRTVALDGEKGLFSGKVDLGKAEKVVGVLQIELDGKPASGRFSIDRIAP